MPATFFCGFAPLLILLNISATIPIVVIFMMITSIAICTWCWIRLRFTGIRVTENEIIVTSWWTRRAYARAEIVRFHEEAYYGFLFVAGWTAYGGVLQSGLVHADLRNGHTVPLHGSVCNRRTARRTSEALNRWVGSELGAGTGPRRAARASRDGREDAILDRVFEGKRAIFVD